MDFGLPKQNFGHLSASSTSNVCEVDIGDFELSSLLLASKYSGLRWVIGIDTVSYNLALIKSNRLGGKICQCVARAKVDSEKGHSVN